MGVWREAHAHRRTLTRASWLLFGPLLCACPRRGNGGGWKVHMSAVWEQAGCTEETVAYANLSAQFLHLTSALAPLASSASNSSVTPPTADADDVVYFVSPEVA
eukprot:4055512-Pleurochrysis_carterae.AAC.1